MIRFIACISLLFLQNITSSQHAKHVNPFIGTGAHGHTFPGATMPHGMVQLSPDTRLRGWDGCSGYHASDSIVYGFSHTHLSGTGVEDYCDVLLMPTTGKPNLDNGEANGKGYRSHFSKQNEVAKAGFYKTYLTDYQTSVELTATYRTGLHRYTFPSQKGNVILDLKHRDKVLRSDLKVVSKTELEGCRISSSWAKEQHLYFVIRFSAPFKEEKRQSDDKGIVSAFSFKLKNKNNQLSVKVGISAVSIEGARKNLDAEISDWDFERVQQNATSAWDKALNVIDIETPDDNQKAIFYTALYHTLIVPNIFQDTDGRYRGLDNQIHQSPAGHTQYSIFSLWDTFRAAHPLYTIIEPERVNDYINTFLNHYEQGGQLPVWELAANETYCMIGTHSIPVIADAYAKGIRGFDRKKALEAMLSLRNSQKFGYPLYYKYGFIPAEEEHESVSKTLEYAYDDAAIAQYYEYLDNAEPEILKDFTSLSLKNSLKKQPNFYQNVFDPATKCVRAKRNNQWVTPFAPNEVNSHFTEGNSWQYSFFAPHDIETLVALHGGRKGFEESLDNLFNASTQTSGREQADLTGLIGQYAHGNEPSHHVTYLYALLGKKWKTERLVRDICKDFYKNTPEGLIGNEDCGQMSAWYILSSLGFYPLNPVGGAYILGTPAFTKATIHLPDNHDFTITAKDFSNSTYVKKVTLDGREQVYPNISHYHLQHHKNLTFEFGKTDTTQLDFYDTTLDKPYEFKQGFVALPYVEAVNNIFFDSLKLTFGHFSPTAKIYYKINQNTDYQVFTKSISIKESSKITFFAKEKEPFSSDTIISHFHKIPNNRKVTYRTPFAPQYNGGGDIALVDLQRGNNNYHLGAWQGFEGKDVEIVIDLNTPQAIHQLSLGALQDQNAWIFMPTEVRFAISTNGVDYQPISTIKNTVDEHEEGTIIKDFRTEKLQNTTARYIKVTAISRGFCPAWHKGAEYRGKAWIFADEVGIE